MNLLLLSNSTNSGEQYLAWTKDIIHDFLAEHNIKTCYFIPFAGVTVSQFDYISKVEKFFNQFGCEITPKPGEDFVAPYDAIDKADCIIVGGGNTFRLVERLQETGLMQKIRENVLKGKPYIGWSAGSNIACPTLCTTNDMPIIQPNSFKALDLIPFQINPHYLDANPEGHGGETREQRIEEYLEINTKMTVAGLREATGLLMKGDKISLVGKRSMRVFNYGKQPVEYEPGTDIQFLLKNDIA